MAWDKSIRKNTVYLSLCILAVLLILIGATWLVRDVWQPHYYKWRCENIAGELNEKYGLVVRYGDPAEFFVPPQPAPSHKDYFIGRTNPHSAFIALEGVQKAISKYPHSLIRNFLKAVFITGTLKIYDVEAGGTYINSWIYISATSDCDSLGSQLYEKILHHELSSLLLVGAKFPIKRWENSNDQSFQYLQNAVEVVKAAEGQNRRNARKSDSLYQDGFVHNYGMSSLNNDFNMYAELAMTDPVKLKTLVQQYPRIKAKTQIFVEFYSGLAPELETYFKSAGLMDDRSGK